MALTAEQVKRLNAPFAYADHEFTRGFVYISEQAVCARIETVDPSWHWDIKSVQVRDNAAVVVGTLTIAGVTREGVGMDKVLENAGEAEKSAATDALKRAARLFGIGRYILDHPKEADFKTWLARMGNQQPAPAPNGHQWTQDEFQTLCATAMQLSIPSENVLGVLGVSRISEYTPGPASALERLQAHAAALKAKYEPKPVQS